MLKKDIPVIKLRWYAWALAVVLLLAGGISFAMLGGFNLGVDFESGLSQRIQIAPIGLEVTYTGNKDAVLAVSGSGLNLEVRGDEGVSSTNFSASEYPTAQDLATALGAVQNINATVLDGSLDTAQILSGYGFPATLSDEPTKLNFQSSGTPTLRMYALPWIPWVMYVYRLLGWMEARPSRSVLESRKVQLRLPWKLRSKMH